MTVKNPSIHALNELGQSVWYDNLSRELLDSGELAELVNAGVSGLTSNPTIFKKAIADSNYYDAAIAELAAENPSADYICDAIMMRDVGAAADLLRPVYDSSKGSDGYASIEVSPLIARDTQSTVDAARRLWSSLDRPNIMVKVPGTDEGLPAVQQLLAEGINVNITLLFSVEYYEKVVDAYLAGLESRMTAGKDLSCVASVASFFVSRVDAICEKGIAARADADQLFARYKGKVGIANSKVAYELFEQKFRSERFAALAAKGARIQRPLWASTGVKNPEYPETLYVEQLAGRATINTVPPKTLAALMDGVSVAPHLHSDLAESVTLLDQLRAAGVAFDQLLTELQAAGVESFSSSYRELIQSIENKARG